MKLDAQEARALLRRCDFGALATHSAKLAGFPFVSHVPLMTDSAARPILLLSHLAEHSRNLAADPRVSLMVAPEEGDPQARPRLSLMGELRPFDAPSALVDRYVRYHPEAATFLGFGDFRFHRLTPVRIRLVGGFARAGWIEAAEWAEPALAEALEESVRVRLAAHLPLGWRLQGVDREGLDARDAEGRRLRLGWPRVGGNEAALWAAACAALEAQAASSAPDASSPPAGAA